MIIKIYDFLGRLKYKFKNININNYITNIQKKQLKKQAIETLIPTTMQINI